jgi:putative phosphonate metabolism protein
MTNGARFAVYFAPSEDSPFAGFGASWLGRDVWSDLPLGQPPVPGISPAMVAKLTASARRYGLHGTLKPPFILSKSRTLGELDAALGELASGQQSFSFGVRVAPLAGFLAWQPTGAFSELAGIADTCVTELDGFRQPPEEAELARRRRAGLSARQAEMLRRWGYPYVLDEFRFHLTLGDAPTAEDACLLQAALEAGCESFAAQSMVFDSLCLFVEPAPRADFRPIARYGFDGAVWRCSAGWCR